LREPFFSQLEEQDLRTAFAPPGNGGDYWPIPIYAKMSPVAPSKIALIWLLE
jgi:hypothetical protein